MVDESATSGEVERLSMSVIVPVSNLWLSLFFIVLPLIVIIGVPVGRVFLGIF